MQPCYNRQFTVCLIIQNAVQAGTCENVLAKGPCHFICCSSSSAYINEFWTTSKNNLHLLSIPERSAICLVMRITSFLSYLTTLHKVRLQILMTASLKTAICTALSTSKASQKEILHGIICHTTSKIMKDALLREMCKV